MPKKPARKPKPDANTAIVRAVDRLTDSGPVCGGFAAATAGEAIARGEGCLLVVGQPRYGNSKRSITLWPEDFAHANPCKLANDR